MSEGKQLSSEDKQLSSEDKQLSSEDKQLSSEDEIYNPVAIGTPLAQVFSVRVRHNGGAQKFEVYGTVRVQHWMSTLHIYNKQQDDSECVHQGGTLSLFTIIDYAHVNYVGRGFTVYLDLKDKDGNEFIKGSFDVPPSDINFSIPDKCQVEDVQGIMGVATIYYASIKVARPFFVYAKLKLGERESSDQPIEIYGRLVASYGKRFCYGEDEESNEHCRIVLFDKKREEAVKILKDELGTWIFLLKESNLGAPIYTPLNIQANFHCVGPNGREERFEDQFEMAPTYIQFVKHKIKRRSGRI